VTANGYTGGGGGGGGGSVAWTDITGKPTTFATTAALISDATTVGRNVVKAADAAAARTVIGAGTSSLVIGTTAGTAAEGNDSRLSNARTPTAHAASHADGGTDEISVDGSQVTTGTVAIGRLPTGTSGSTVSLGNHTHTASQISDSTTIGRSLLTATDAAAARSALTLLPAILLGPVDSIPGGTPTNTLVIRTT